MKTSLLIILAMIGLFLTACTTGATESFAKCLTEKGVKMYGAYWCPHCQNQKELFGQNWQYVNSVECATPGVKEQNKICADANIEGYPTWVFADGSRQAGEMKLKELADKTNCPL